MAEGKEIPRVLLLPDEPITSWQADKLDTARFAEVIASAAHHTETPFTIGIFGKWGQGKTSVLKQAESLIAGNYKDDVTVWFNAWQYEQEEVPIVPLILTIAETLEQGSTNQKKSVEYLRKAGKMLIAIARSTKLNLSYFGTGIEVSGKDLVDGIAGAANDIPPEILPISVYVRAFSELLRITNAYRENGETGRIIVFIDDLDRCLPKRAVALLQGIKLVLNQPGFVFILGLDRQILEDHLVKIYQEDGSTSPTENGRRFIDKIIQLPLPLPRQDDLASYIEKLLKRPEFKVEENVEVRKVIKDLKDIIAMGANTNPRNVVRFINNLIVDRVLLIPVEKGHEIADRDLLGIAAVSRILREHLGDTFYVALSDNPEFCERIANEEALLSMLLRNREEKPYLRQERQQQDIAQRLDEAPFLRKLLQTKFGKMWLTEHDLRNKVDKFLGEERGEEGKRNLTAIAKQAILNGEEIPLPAKELATIRTMSFYNTSINDAKLAHLKKITNLKWLILSKTQITDVGLVNLEKLPNLEALDLGGTKITDAGLVHLKKLPNLQTLDLGWTQVTNAGLVHLKEFPRLISLNLFGTKITDAGLVHLKKLPNLEDLDLGWTQITDAGLVHLEEFPKLISLNLSGTQITDTGLAHLEKLSNLKGLFLSKTQITNTGLVHLEELSNLLRLDVSGTKITDARLKRLKKHLPRLTSIIP